jgi:hypothetical protein
MINRQLKGVLIVVGWVTSMVISLAVLSNPAAAVPPSTATDLDYRIVGDGAIIEGCGGHDCRDGLVIPSTIIHNHVSYPVVAIANNAFEYPDDDDEDDGEPELVVIGAVVIPDSVTSIGNEAFLDQKFITSVVVGDGVTTIGDEAFEDNYALASLTLGTSVATIGASAFYDNRSLTALVLPDSLRSVGNAAFRSSPIADLQFGSGIESIGNYGFANTYLGAVTLPDSLTTIGQYAFARAEITAVTIGASVSVIDFGAFSTNQLTSVTLPASVATVAGSAFGWMPTLTYVALEGAPPAVTGNVFLNSSNLPAVHVWNGLGYGDTWGDVGGGKPTVIRLRAPSAPTNVTAVSGDGSVTVSWLAPTVSDATVSSYVVTAAPDGAQCSWTAGPLTCEVSGLTNGTAYTFSVTATSTIGTSPASVPSAPSVPTEPIPPAIPDSQPVVTPEPPAPVLEREAAEQVSGVEDLQLVAPTRQAISLLPLAMLTERPSRGAQVTVTYGGFEPSELVQFVVASTPQVLGTAHADAAGSVTMTFQIPADLGPGVHTLAVYAPGSGHGARQLIEAEPVTLPATGPATGAALWTDFAVLFAALGGLLAITSSGRLSRQHALRWDRVRLPRSD